MNKSKYKLIIATGFALSLGVGAAFVASEIPGLLIESLQKTTTSVVYAANEDQESLSVTERAYEQIVSLFRDTTRPPAPATSARSYIIGDVTTGEIIAELNPDDIHPIASVSKLFTAVVADQVYAPGAQLSVSRDALATYGSSGGLVYGERFTLDQLLDPLLLESSNDTAEVVAMGYGRDLFMQEMNDLAEALQLSGTSFDDPSGLSPENLSTARDLFTFARYLYDEYPELIARTRVPYVESARTPAHSYHYWHNRNSFVSLDDELYIGGKTGYTPEAAQTMLAFFTLEDGALNDHTYAVAVLQSGARNKDVASLMNYATEGLYGVLSSAASALLGSAARTIDEPVETTSLVFVGDIMLDRGVEQSVQKYFDGDFNALFEDVDFLEKGDITFGNLEGPLSDRGYDLRNLYSFRMDPEALPALTDAGFDVLSLANNHVGDWGRPAFEDTMERLRSAGVAYVGAGFNRSDAVQPRIIERNGMTFGFLALSDQGPAWLSGPENSSVVLLASDPKHDQLISDAAEQVDVLVVSYHFGEEYEEAPNERQRELATRAIDAGARIVVGHHPHVVQDVERYNDGLIAYSLGNFIFDQNFSEETMRGLALEVLFEEGHIVRVTPKEVVLDERFVPRLGE